MLRSYPSLSTYNYCRNNPLSFIDLSGKSFYNTVSTLSYDEDTKRHTITTITTKVTEISRTETKNSDGSTTLTIVEQVETITTTVIIDRSGKTIDSNGKEVSEIAQTTNLTKRTTVSNSQKMGFKTSETLINSSSKMVAASTNKLGSALSAWLQDGNAGKTPFFTLRNVSNISSYGSLISGVVSLMIKNSKFIGLSSVILSGIDIGIEAIHGTGSIKNRWYPDTNVKNNVGHHLYKYYKK